MLNYEEQVVFYRKIYDAFSGTELDYGLRTHWFKEFTPDFCCSAVNCGNKFFLVDSNGKVSACPRGQASDSYTYGNILSDDIETIISNGWKQIESNENRLGINEECLSCEFFPYCNLGCTFVRDETKTNKSYTCLLQKEIYRDNPKKYPPYSLEYIKSDVKNYLFKNNITHLSNLESFENKEYNITPELYSKSNNLSSIIKQDPILGFIYGEELFKLEVNNQYYPLHSQILKNRSDILFLDKNSKIYLHCQEDVFMINCDPKEQSNNNLHIMALRNTPIVYGDEGRTKQEHIFDYSLYQNSLLESSEKIGKYYRFEITSLLLQHQEFYIEEVKNNLFFTTKNMRAYHYLKHKKNAFYHIQAINLPFSNIEFFWLGE
jgi:uncharacterized protein